MTYEYVTNHNEVFFKQVMKQYFSVSCSSLAPTPQCVDEKQLETWRDVL